MPFSEDTLTRLKADAAEITARYPRARSALQPLLYLVQAEEGYVSRDGIAFCAEVLGISQTEVRGVATFYTMYKHEPNPEYQIGVCTNTTCAIMGADHIFGALAEKLGADPSQVERGHHDIHSPDGKIGLEHLECNAACDYAPVVMVNWEFFDNQTPDSAKELVDDIRAGNLPVPTRGPKRLCTWKQANRILAGFGDGQAADGPSAGPASLVGLKLAKEHGWKAPSPADSGGSSPREAQSL